MKVFSLLMLLATAGTTLAETCSLGKQCQCLFPDKSHCCLYGAVCLPMSLLSLGTNTSHRTQWPGMNMIAQNCVRVLVESFRVAKMPQQSAMRAVISPVPLSSLRRLALHATMASRYFVPRYTRESLFLTFVEWLGTFGFQRGMPVLWGPKVGATASGICTAGRIEDDGDGNPGCFNSGHRHYWNERHQLALRAN